MKIKFNYILYIAFPFLLILFLTKCKDEGVKPNNCEATGICDVMTCKIDGTNWVADCNKDAFFGCDPVSCIYSKELDQLGINGGSFVEPTIGIGFLTDSSISELGFHRLLYMAVLYCSHCDPKNIDKDPYYLDTMYLAGKQIEILKFDTIQRVIEANFNYRAIEYTSLDTVYITDGYFKLTY